jgi:TPR repeat protein
MEHPMRVATLLATLSLSFMTLCHAANVTNSTSPGPDEPIRKFALVIGNSNYLGYKRSLKNPINDAKLMAESLSRLGFQVKQYTDLDRAGFVNAVGDFASALPAGATALVFYAGHGMQIGGLSYLIPTDMPVTSEQSVPLRAYPVKTLLERISATKSSVNVVVFDACRDNPFQPQPPLQYRNFANLGLAPVQAPRGTVIAYSTAPGQLAADGKEGNSLYTAALAKVIQEPGLSLEDVFKKVSSQVRKTTFDDQIPWFESSLTEEYFFLPPAGVTVVAGRPLKRASIDGETKTAGRGVTPYGSATDALWYRSLTEQEWTILEQTLQDRANDLKPEDLPTLKHQANGGSVVAQTTLARALRDGLRNTSGSVSAPRNAMDLDASVQWFQKASDAGFPIAQLDLGEMRRNGNGVPRDAAQARQLIELASKANYPRAQLQLLKLGIEDKLVNRDDVKVRLADLESKIQTLGSADGAPLPNEMDQKDQKQKSIVLLRKELAQRGLKWNGADFGDALMNGDLETVKMYLDAGWNPLSLYEEGNALAHFIWRTGNLDALVTEAMLKLFVEHGVDPNAPVLKFRGLAPISMALNAVRSCNSAALSATIKLGAITSSIASSMRQGGYVNPAEDAGVNCETNIAKIGSLLNMKYRCSPKSWGSSQVACELF